MVLICISLVANYIELRPVYLFDLYIFFVSFFEKVNCILSFCVYALDTVYIFCTENMYCLYKHIYCLYILCVEYVRACVYSGCKSVGR